LRPLLDERQQRALMAVEAQAWGHGGITAVARRGGIGADRAQRD